ncbi:4-hydroxybenzoate polyprenyltransferase/phosphoserine phosphatase [Paraburkholderia bannensis]|uniref:4-hydroxybenzoate polyprenyltransferase/phosphoserine phosphatase n=1 Tax=Paraburkholderia bannensis TaxID=765414 RepID=A0A7W9TX41_9BURK|nr:MULTISPECIES: UbiA family prenyltransferase [Paraburkholderia]MBB3257993.1 4-hydroxybenzoate polyprenyltransferase/phosphoserine phosphatase [Paraburkholderia sp. WP4_3_2]MBB6103006.1 4-hydroxybenzoate polyprenyltransferase/phosphoserine phosphatase [Paraburkholderia bannensis]
MNTLTTSDSSMENPLVVDLDGSLIANDLLHEAVVTLLFRHPLQFLLALPMLAQGKAAFKHRIAMLVAPDVVGLPYRQAVLDLISTARICGRRVFLATASHERYGNKVADHLGMFDGRFATSADLNLASGNKAAELVAAFGEKGFDYVGNSKADVAVWQHARRAYAIGASHSTIKMMQSVALDSEVLPTSSNRFRVWRKALRVHQYAKNVLVFLPMLAGHMLDWQIFFEACVAFVAFSATASAIYIINDLVDLEDDRLHPTKKHRPLAAGEIGVFHALAVGVLLLVLGSALAVALAPKFALTLLAYFALTTSYSFFLKRKILIDIVVLALLYEMRVIAGGYATGIELSNWLLGFCVFVFASLALIKRYTELLVRLDAGLPEARNRGYRKEDLPIISALAAATGLNAVTVLGLYIDSPRVSLLYHHPQWLWGTCPLMLFLISRALLVAHRREMDDDPLVWALRDRVCRIGGALFVAIVMIAAFL